MHRNSTAGLFPWSHSASSKSECASTPIVPWGFGILMSGNSLSKGLLIVSIINDQNVRKWNDQHRQRQIRVGQIVLKVTLGRGLNHVKRWQLGIGIEHRPSRSSSPIATSFNLHGPAVNVIKQKDPWLLIPCFGGFKVTRKGVATCIILQFHDVHISHIMCRIISMFTRIYSSSWYVTCTRLHDVYIYT